MPLIILGLIVMIGIVIYGLIIYANSDERDTRPVRERYSHVFDRMSEHMKKKSNYTIIDDDEEPGSGSKKAGAEDGDGHTMYFPTDAELEKRKRNIH